MVTNLLFLDNFTNVIYIPARFYVFVALKMILLHLVADYEFKLADPTSRSFFNSSYARMGNPFFAVLVCKRGSFGLVSVSKEHKGSYKYEVQLLVPVDTCIRIKKE